MTTVFLMALATVAIGLLLMRWRLRTPRRRYEGLASVSRTYDDWTNDGVLEQHWSDHLHAGYYGVPPRGKDFVAAKVDFIEALIRWAVTAPNPALAERLQGNGTAGESPVRVLDVGCGLGGSVRHMARRWPAARVAGITISRAQARRATALAREQGVANAEFLECDALHLPFADATFDVVWAVESECHIADKQRLIHEMTRVLKPGGAVAIAAWNLRDTRTAPLSAADEAHLRILLDEWCHARFAPVREFLELLGAGALEGVATDDWTVTTQPSWRHAVRMGLRHPSALAGLDMAHLWLMARDAYTILCFGSAFRNGLCEYGVFRARKPAQSPATARHAGSIETATAWQPGEPQGSVV